MVGAPKNPMSYCQGEALTMWALHTVKAVCSEVERVVSAKAIQFRFNDWSHGRCCSLS